MGRMLDSLKQVNGQPSAGGESKPAAADKAASAPVAPVSSTAVPNTPNPAIAEPSDTEEYLFIEVGAPDKKIEASPRLLAAVPATAAKPAPPAPATAKAATTLVPKLSEPQPLGVTFETWPAKGQTVASEIIAFHRPEHAVSKQYAALFARMREGAGQGEGRVLLLIGSAPQIGVTTVVLNLAFAGCAACHGVVVMEASSQPALRRRLGLAPGAGLAEVLCGAAALEKTVLPSADPRVHVLTAGDKVKCITPEAVRWVLGWLRDRYEMVLVDGPHLGDAEATSALVQAADAVYLVLPQDEGGSAKVTAWTQTISRLGGRLRGLIHTHFETA